MLQGQQPGMQRLPIQRGEGRLALPAELARLGLEMRAIDRIAKQGVAGMRQMDPDLVGPAGLELAVEQGGDRLAVPAGERLPHLIMGDGLAATFSRAWG